MPAEKPHLRLASQRQPRQEGSPLSGFEQLTK